MDYDSRSTVTTEMNATRNVTMLPTKETSRASLTPATYQQEVIVTAVIAILLVWCVIGNTITILAITTVRHMLTKTNVFILSLAFSDLLSGLIASPLWLYRRTWGFADWKLGTGACKLFFATDESTSYCTAMHIASFAIWRFILIKRPHKTAGIKRRSIVIWVSVIWMVSVTFGGLIMSSFFEVIDKKEDGGIFIKWPMCSVNYRDNGVPRLKAYYTFTSVAFLMLPMLILFLSSIVIMRELLFNKSFKSSTRKQKEKRAVAQLAMIAMVFMIGYVPITVYSTWTLRAVGNSRRHDYWFATAAYLCLRFSECMNPVAYNLSSRRMWKASKKVIDDIWTCRGRRVSSSAYTSAVAARSIITEGND